MLIRLTTSLSLVLSLTPIAGCMVNNGGGGGGTGGGGSMVGDCPGGSTCSPKTPDGLDFEGAKPLLNAFPPTVDSGHNQIAVGGTDAITLQDDGQPFSLPYTTAIDNADALEVVATTGPEVELRGLGGVTELNIVDPSTQLIFDRYAYASSALGTAQTFSPDVVVSSSDPLGAAAPAFAFWPGDLDVGVALVDTTGMHRLIDTSATLAVTGGSGAGSASQTRWDELSIPGATAGDYPVDVALGSGDGDTAQATVHVVDHIDEVVALTTTGGVACFEAETDGAFVAGVPWTFKVAGSPALGNAFGPNCVATSGSAAVTVTAEAGDQQVTVTAKPQ